MAYEKGTPEERFWRKVMPEPNTGCWFWMGAGLAGNGYGQFWDGEKRVGAHRFSYELHKGPIPDGYGIDHSCNIGSCVNPDHLDAVTQAENMRRCFQRGRGHNKVRETHCIRGHELTPENTFTRRDGRRRCRACMRVIDRLAEKRRRELSLFR